MLPPNLGGISSQPSDPGGRLTICSPSAETDRAPMHLGIRRISVKFALLLAVAAVVPLLAYGFISLLSLERGTRQTVIQGNRNVAPRAAEKTRRYVATNADLLKALSAHLQDTGLTQEQQDRS